MKKEQEEKFSFTTFLTISLLIAAMFSINSNKPSKPNEIKNAIYNYKRLETIGYVINFTQSTYETKSCFEDCDRDITILKITKLDNTEKSFTLLGKIKPDMNSPYKTYIDRDGLTVGCIESDFRVYCNYEYRETTIN